MKRLLTILCLLPVLTYGQSISPVLSGDTPNQGMAKINANFDTLLNHTSSYTSSQLDSTVEAAKNFGWYNVKRFGAVGDGVTDDRLSIQKAIDTAAAHGGGTIYFPRGTYLLRTPSLTDYYTVDTIPAPVGKCPVFSRGNVFLKISSNSIALRGDGIGQTILTTDSVGTILNASNTWATPLTGIGLYDMTLRYMGGWKGGTGKGTFGAYILGNGATVERVEFRNFLNSLIYPLNSKDCSVQNSRFTSDHGRASCGYPSSFQASDTTVWSTHPAVFIRNYGTRTRIVNNFADCLSDSDFTSVSSLANVYKTPMDGLVHGYGDGGVYVGNTVVRFAYEAIYVQEGKYPASTLVSVSGNTVDGLQQTWVSGCPSSDSVNYTPLGRFGIRVDCDNASITGNVIRNVSMDGILISHEDDDNPRLHRNVVIGNNTITEAGTGVYIASNTRDVVVSGNLIKPLTLTSAIIAGHVNYRYGLLIEQSQTAQITVLGNMFKGSATDWYFKTITSTGTESIGDTVVKVSSTTGLRIGDYINHGYSSTSAGRTYYIERITADSVEFNSPLYSVGFAPGDSLRVTTGASLANVGVATYGSDSLTVMGNTFTGFRYPVQSTNSSTIAVNNATANCINEISGPSSYYTSPNFPYRHPWLRVNATNIYTVDTLQFNTDAHVIGNFNFIYGSKGIQWNIDSPQTGYVHGDSTNKQVDIRGGTNGVKLRNNADTYSTVTIGDTGYTQIRGPLSADNGGWTSTAQTTLNNAINEQAFWRVGTWATNSHDGLANVTQAATATRMSASPFIIRKTITIDSILTEVSGAAAGAMTPAIYNDSTAGRALASPYPMNCIWNGGRDTTSAGIKSHSLSGSPLTLTPGLYWAVAHANNGATFRALPVAAVPNVMGANPAMGANSQNTGYYYTRTYDQYLPSPYAAGATTSAGAQPILLLMHIKSIP